MYQQGIDQTHDKDYAKALDLFQKAENTIPGLIVPILASWDIHRINTESGIASYKLAYQIWESKGMSDKVLQLYTQAKDHLEKALAIDPNIYIPAYWEARTVATLEVLHNKMKPGQPNPYNAGPLFEKAIVLRPNGITVHHYYARYLYSKKQYAKLKQIVQYMTEIYPPSYQQIKKETYYSDDLRPELEKGLLTAFEKKISPRDTHQSLAALYSDKELYPKAIDHYSKSLEFRPFANTWHNYVHLGVLYLKSEEPEKSIPWFTKALKKAEHFEKALQQIYNTYNREQKLDEFISLCDQLGKSMIHPPVSLDLFAAKAWMAKEKFSIAKSRLLRLIAETPDAQAYYLLARIAQEEKDWDQMEINAQKATTLDRENSDYYYLFSISLQRQKKYAHAEEIASKAIEYDKRENPWLYNHRAWTRWSQRKYPQAISDWNRAFTLKPDNSDFPYCIAMAYEREGMFKEGLDQIQKALALAPPDKKDKYLKFRKRLQSHK